MNGKWGILCSLIMTGCVMADGEFSASTQPHVLHPDKPVIKRVLDESFHAPHSKKYVQVNIAAVVNPQLVPLSFTVYTQSGKQEKILLGTFSLFPPDNPGVFIVPAQGRLISGNAIFIELEIHPEMNSQNNIEVVVESIRLVNQLAR